MYQATCSTDTKPLPNLHAHTHTHTQTYTQTHTHTHTHTHTQMALSGGVNSETVYGIRSGGRGGYYPMRGGRAGRGELCACSPVAFPSLVACTCNLCDGQEAGELLEPLSPHHFSHAWEARASSLSLPLLYPDFFFPPFSPVHEGLISLSLSLMPKGLDSFPLSAMPKPPLPPHTREVVQCICTVLQYLYSRFWMKFPVHGATCT